MSTADKHPITCHVLDTTTGRPAAKIPVELTCLVTPISYIANTNADGRIMTWEGKNKAVFEGIPVHKFMEGQIKDSAEKDGTPSCPKRSSLWKLSFDTGSYYGAEKTFFPKVELTFLVKEGEHFHVPLLLGPYSFTTYRGS